MKKFRFFLAFALAVCLCTGVGFANNIVNAASTTINLSSATVTPGYSMRWFPNDNTSGFSLTNGGKQSMYFSMGEKGNKINIGFMKYSTKVDESFYSGTVSSYTKSASKTLTGDTAYYQPYLTNKNETVYITVKQGSYVTIQ